MRRAYLALFFITAVWGLYYLGISAMLDSGWDPVFMNTIRFTIAAACLVAVVLALGRGREMAAIQRGEPIKILGPALCILVGTALISFAQKSVDSGIAGVILSSTPLFAALLGSLAVFGARRVGPAAWVGVVIGLLGVGLLYLPAIGEGSKPWAIGMLVISAASFALEAHLTAKWFSGQDLLAVTALMVCWTALGFWLWTAIDGSTDSGSWLLIAIFAVFSNALAFMAYLWLVRGPGPTFANVYAYLVPAIALGAGFLFAGETITLVIIAGALLCVGGALLVGRDSAEAVER